jgi:hypothetical protein
VQSYEEEPAPSKRFSLPFEVISEEEMRSHERRGAMQDLPGLNDEELETPAFLRQKRMS